MALPDAEETLAALAERMRGAIAFDAKFVGIYSGGAWMAERLAQIDSRRSCGRVHRRFVLSRRFQPQGTEAGGQAHRAAVRSRGRDHRAGRRRALHGPQRARGDQRAVRLRPARRASSLPCWSIAAAASCRSRRPTSAPGSPSRGPVDRAVARTRSGSAGARRTEASAMRNPQLNAARRAHAPADARGPARRDHPAASSIPRCRSRRSPSAR